MDFVVPPGELSSGSTNSGGNGGGNSDYNTHGSNMMIKKELLLDTNPYTPHDSGHSSIESIEHQLSSSSSQCSSSCRNCGRIEYSNTNSAAAADPQQQQYETIKLDELFTHVTPSPPPSSASPSTNTGSTAGTSLRKSILQNGLCSTCVHSKNSKTTKLNDSCSNSPSRSSSIESPSSGIGNSTVILKAEPVSVKQEVYESNEYGMERMLSIIPSSSIITSTQHHHQQQQHHHQIIPNTTTIMHPNNDTKMQVEVKEVIPIPHELAMEMMKNMSATSIPTVSNSNYVGSFHLVDSSQFHQHGEHNITYQHVSEEVVISTASDENMILSSPSVYSTIPNNPPHINLVPSSFFVSSEQTPRKQRAPSINNPNKIYSTVTSISDTIDDVLVQCRQYAHDHNEEIAQDLSRSIKIEVSERLVPYINTSKFAYTNNNNNYAETINKVGSMAGSSSSGPLVIARKSAPPPTVAPVMFITNANNIHDKSVGCGACNKTFKNKRLCKAHYQRVHEKLKKYNCHLCGANFVYRGSLDSHLNSHKINAIKHHCNICGESFRERTNLNQHLRVHQHSHRKFKCEFCPSSFSKRVNARYHMKRKHPDLYPTSNMYLSTYGANPANSQQQQQQQNMIPNTSGVGVGSSGMMYGSHHQLTTTTPLPSYNPQDYSIMLSSQSNQPDAKSLSNNEPDRKSEGNFKCEYCGRGFLFKNNLKAHLRTHTRDKKYTCNLCEKGFIYKESLKNHMLLHSNSFPYTCEICHKSFRDRSNRRKHVKNVHKHLLVNGEIPSSYQGTNTASSSNLGGTSSGAPVKKRQTRTRKPKKAQASAATSGDGNVQYGNLNEFSTSESAAPNISNIKPAKNTKKSGKNQGNKNVSNPRNTNNNKSVIVSTNASSSTDLDRGIIMNSSGNQNKTSMEYNFLSSSNLPVTVHIPSINIPGNQSQQQQQSAFAGRNIIVKATGGVASSDPLAATNRLPTDQTIYLNTGGTPMQQNVIVYPKPKTSLLESYSSEINQSVIAPNIQQYYTQATYNDSNAGGTSYAHLIPSRLSPGGTSSAPPTFAETTFIPSLNRGRSNSITGISTISNSETNETVGAILQRGNTVQYSTSISAPPIYSGGPTSSANNATTQQYQFWSQVPVSSPATQNSNNNTQTFYNPTIISTTASAAQLMEGGSHNIISTTPNVITVPAYSTSEVLVSTDPTSSNNYYKDFDFKLFYD